MSARSIAISLLAPRGSRRRWWIDGRRAWPPSAAQYLASPSWSPDDGDDWLVFVDSTRPTPDHDSGSRRLVEIMRIAQGLGYATLFAAGAPGPFDAHYENSALGISACIPLKSLRRSAGAWHWAPRLCVIARPENWHQHAAALRRALPGACQVYDSVDLHSERLREQARRSGAVADRLEARCVSRWERSAIRAADSVVVVSECEAELVRPWARRGTVVIPNAHRVPPRVPRRPRAQTLTFVGSFRHRPNRDAAEWLVDEIAPLILEKRPACVIQVVGADPPAELVERVGGSVRFLGWVQDVDAIYDRTDIAIAPLRYGAGLKGKVGEAMAHGIPVVTTPIGAEGFGLSDGRDALIADDAAGIAGAVELLLGDADLAERVGLAGRERVESEFSIEALDRRLRELLPEVRAR